MPFQRQDSLTAQLVDVGAACAASGLPVAAAWVNYRLGFAHEPVGDPSILREQLQKARSLAIAGGCYDADELILRVLERPESVRADARAMAAAATRG